MVDTIRPRSLTPPPRPPPPAPAPVPPPPPQPSSSYINEAEDPSTTLNDPSDLRKLLVLDLNGSLLIRAAHTGSRSSEGSQPRLRATHPRPYLNAFRNYILSDETREWLDVMVWSSAQPHSVEGMVDACFGEEKSKLVAVWARDTLGLSKADYYRKSATLKDLTKPWAAIGLESNSEAPPASSPNHRPRSRSLSPTPPAPSSQPLSSPTQRQQHSARTTLLLDDSPAKAALQPWNHICLQEYTPALRASDLAIFTHERVLVAAQKSDTSDEATPSTSETPAAITTETDADAASQSQHQKKKKEKKKKKLAAAAEAGNAPGVFDNTLLAIIGVLDALKHESNVAGWIRAGGLWGPQGVRPVTSEDDKGTSTPSVADGQSDTTPTGSEGQELVVAEGNNASDAVVSESVPKEPAPAPALMWFEHQPTVAYWVERGQRACEELGIQVEHGIER